MFGLFCGGPSCLLFVPRVLVVELPQGFKSLLLLLCFLRDVM